MRAARLLFGLALAAVGAAGCHDFHYYDVTVAFNGDSTQANGFKVGEIGNIQVCVMSVSGADSGSFRIGPNSQGLPVTSGSLIGTFEFSTFEDSGTLNFKVEAYDASNTTPDCKVGEGTTSVMATATTTNTAMLTVNRTGNFTCTNM